MLPLPSNAFFMCIMKLTWMTIDSSWIRTLIKLISYTCPKFSQTLLLEFKMISKVKKIEISLLSVQSLSRVRFFATPWTAVRQTSLSITNSRSPPKPMSIVSVMPSNHLILCCLFLLLPSVFPNIRVLSTESALLIGWPKYWSFSFSISPSNEYSGLISFKID